MFSLIFSANAIFSQKKKNHIKIFNKRHTINFWLINLIVKPFMKSITNENIFSSHFSLLNLSRSILQKWFSIYFPLYLKFMLISPLKRYAILLVWRNKYIFFHPCYIQRKYVCIYFHIFKFLIWICLQNMWKMKMKIVSKRLHEEEV